MQQIQTTIAEVLAGTNPPVVSPSDTAASAVALMKEQHASCVLVCEDGSLEGIFTERDYLNRVAAERLKPGRTAVGDVMTPRPETLQPLDSVAHGISMMAINGFRNIPIVDADGGAVGVLSVRNVIAQLGDIFSQAEDGPADDTFNDWIDIGGG